MSEPRQTWSRRKFACGLTLAGTASLLAMGPEGAAAEPPPETKRVTLAQTTSMCHAPQYIAEALLKGEGFTEIHYLKDAGAGVEAKAIASGDAQISLTSAGPLLLRIDAGDPVLLLAGGHVGCLELFGHDPVRAVSDLKGKRVVVYALESAPHVFLASVMAFVGLDHRKDVTIFTRPPAEALQMFAERRVDAFVASPPIAQELRAKGIGRVVINSTTDRPWSQYFCCFVAGHRDFVRKYPVATKRALRAILKSADVCSIDPARAARTLVDRGFTKSYDYALQAMKEIPYARWRDYEPEDTVRFYALRLREAGPDQGDPPEDHCRRHRLALPPRAEERAEGVTQERAQGAEA
jgi:NitT/TauT family transport system substrate-binding protein